MRLAARRLLASTAASLLLQATAVGVGSAGASSITIVNFDGAGEGLNDPTQVAPVGGNAGTTRGTQRLIALQHAAGIWAGALQSDVEIRVDAQFDPLACSGSSAVLGSAGPNSSHANFSGAPVANTWYPQALASKLAGVDVNPSVDDIGMTFNRSLGAGCAFPAGFYYGLDASPAGGDLDFVTIALHEIGHGLGFLTLIDLPTGAKELGFNDAYMRNLENHATGKLFPGMSDAERAMACTSPGNLHWVGPAVLAEGVTLIMGRHVPSGHVEMYAPSSLAPGSSVSHFGTSLFPNELMEPFYTGPDHDVGLTLALLRDIGWDACGDGVVESSEACDDGDATPGDGCSAACAVEPCWTCIGEPSVCAPLSTGTACDDGDACTQTDTCAATSCVGSDPVVCSPLDQCHDGGTCSPLSGLCSNPPKPNGAPCDDGEVCTTGDQCTNALCGGTPSCVDPFLCFKDKITKNTPTFEQELGVSLDDRFETLSVDVVKPRHLCTPADKDGAGTLDAATHLESYKVRPAKGSPKHLHQTNVAMTNVIGTIYVDTVKPELLLVPTAQNPSATPPAPNPANHAVDHYKCYKTAPSPGMPRLPTGILVDLVGQITGPAKTFEVVKPTHLCTPVDQAGNGIKHTAIHQVCYKIRLATGELKHVPQIGIYVNNAFGLERLDTTKEELLCLPSVELP